MENLFIGSLNNQYNIIKILHEKPTSVVLLVQEKDGERRLAAKVYSEAVYGEFIHERTLNELLIDNTGIVRSFRCIDQSQVCAPFTCPNWDLEVYSFIVLEYYENGSLLDFMRKAAYKGRYLSNRLVKCYWRQLVFAV